MPNHVHIVVKPLEGYELEDVIQGWKSYTAKRLLALYSLEPPLWQDEYYHRIVRDTPHPRRCVSYTENNPNLLIIFPLCQ